MSINNLSHPGHDKDEDGNDNNKDEDEDDDDDDNMMSKSDAGLCVFA